MVRRKIGFPFSLLLFLILLSAQATVCAQKLYYGFGYSTGILSRVQVNHDFLSETNSFNEPYKIKKHTQFNFNNFVGYRIEISGGIQVKRCFFEINLCPYYYREFLIKAQQANYGKSETIKKLGYRFEASDIALRFKYVISGRKYVRTSIFTGISESYSYKKTTTIDKIESDFTLFDWRPSFNASVQVGTEFIFNNGKDNIMLSVYYEQLIKSYSDQIKAGYFYLGFRYLFYSNKQKRTIYINE